jgi:chorismate mutase|tara:strand:+ start:205 stop:573 length:369 start_codon:yes stop_codon:yes gene_type:complete
MNKSRGIRGATTSKDNTKNSIIEATKELLEQMINSNSIDLEDISFAIFTTTKDLNAEFPALAARLIGWEDIALMCAHEIDVPGAQKLCIRILLTINTEKTQKELVNIYLRDAVNLKSRGITE